MPNQQPAPAVTASTPADRAATEAQRGAPGHSSDRLTSVQVMGIVSSLRPPRACQVTNAKVAIDLRLTQIAFLGSRFSPAGAADP
jgi:hypothetical protein